MLSKEDIQNLIKEQKEVFTTKGDLAVLKDGLKQEFKDELIEVFATREEVATKKH